MDGNKADRYGPGIGDAAYGSAAHRLGEQLGTYGLSPNLETALAAVAELQERLGREQRERVAQDRTIRELERRLEADQHVVGEAQRALMFLTRGECINDAHRHRPNSGRFATHAAVHAYHCEQLAHGAPTLNEALQAIVELCGVVHGMQHEAKEDLQQVEGLEAQIEHLEHEAQQIEHRFLPFVQLAYDLARATGVGIARHHMTDRQLLTLARQALDDLTGSRYTPHKPDPWDDDGAQERAAIEAEPPSVWTRLRKPAL